MVTLTTLRYLTMTHAVTGLAATQMPTMAIRAGEGAAAEDGVRSPANTAPALGENAAEQEHE